MNIVCKICGQSCVGNRGISSHVNKAHGWSAREYYDKYRKTEDEGKCVSCGVGTEFHGGGRGYSDYCQKCGSKVGLDSRSREQMSLAASNRNKTMWQKQEYADSQSSRLSVLMTETNRTTLAVRSQEHCANISAGIRRAMDGGYTPFISPEELLVKAYLEERGYTHQWQFHYESQRHYNLDFFHPTKRINIEIDGWTHAHSEKEDAVRDACLTLLGCKVLRIRSDVAAQILEGKFDDVI